MKKAVALILFLGTAAPAAAQTPASTSTPAATEEPEIVRADLDMAKLEQALSTKRREIVSAAMGGLTADQMKTFWSVYARRWTVWNHVRTTACIAAAALLTATA